MGFRSWLRAIAADILGADRDAVSQACSAAEARLRAARDAAAVAVAQQRRAKLELQEFLAAGAPSPTSLRGAVVRAEEAQERAEDLIREYRRSAAELRELLEKAEDLQLLEAANEERRRLVGAAEAASAWAHLAAVEQAHDEATGELARLDILDRLNAGTLRLGAGADAEDSTVEELKARARALLEPQAEQHSG